ncbi:hypothetical protein AKO1_006318 [Acrasis kona]|uniref:Tryptophan synthase beta chain-like PALP domain-containing protein n=1 Tax=Acrasis kona TaxID=1008807 RepID=A0AAW2YI01_9EUKA
MFILTTTNSGPYQGNKNWKLLHYKENVNSVYSNVKNVTSWGGTQSNSMLAIAKLTNENGWGFDYYSQRHSKPCGGNYQEAIALGMRMHYVQDYEQKIKHIKLQTAEDPQHLIVPIGGCSPTAEYGIKKVAEYIKNWNHLDTSNNSLNVLLPSGTGTTSFYLAKQLACREIKVFTVPCVGGEEYLREQICKNLSEEDTSVLNVVTTKTFPRFAHPYKEFLSFWENVKSDTSVELDLIYAPKTILSARDYLKSDPKAKWLYIHTGGTSGNVTQIKRFKV